MRKSNKKAFTLIELLAVIVILAIIALIAVPVIMNIINKANKSAFKDTAYGIINAGEMYYAEQLLDVNGMQGEVVFNFPDNIGTLGIKGKLPTSGSMKVNDKGKVEIAITNGRYCITKRYDENDITVIENADACMFPFPTEGSVITYNPVEDTLCTNYTESNSQTGVTEGCLRWYVHKVEDDKITLMLDHNTNSITIPISNGHSSISDKILNDTGKIVYFTSNNILSVYTEDWKAEADYIAFEDILYSIPWFVAQEDKSDLVSMYLEYQSLVAQVENQIKTQVNPNDYETEEEYIDALVELANKTGLVPKEYMYRDLLKGYVTGNIDTYGYIAQPFMAETYNLVWGLYIYMVYPIDFTSSTLGIRPIIELDSNYKAKTKQVTDLIIENESVNINVGSTSNITTYVGPKYIENNHQKLKYTSSDESIATVDANGIITGVGLGSTSITVKTIDGSDISKIINVTVKQPVTNLDLGITTLSLKPGDTYQINPTITPTNAANKELSYSSYNSSIVTVSSNGLITAVASGTTTINVRTNDGSYLSKKINVTVEPYKNGIMTSDSDCINSGICSSGTSVRVAVNNGSTYKFYVINDMGNELTLIMDSNLGDNVAWYEDAFDNSYGPTIAVAALKERTSGWTNIPEKEYTYSDDGGGNKYTAFTEKMRARLITYTEATSEKIGCTTSNGSCPSWMYANLYTTGSDVDDFGNYRYGYWTSAAAANGSWWANVVERVGSIYYFDVYCDDANIDECHPGYSYAGLRPVIELTK